MKYLDGNTRYIGLAQLLLMVIPNIPQAWSEHVHDLRYQSQSYLLCKKYHVVHSTIKLLVAVQEKTWPIALGFNDMCESLWRDMHSVSIYNRHIGTSNLLCYSGGSVIKRSCFIADVSVIDRDSTKNVWQAQINAFTTD